MSDEEKRGPGRPPAKPVLPVLLLKNYRPMGKFRVEDELPVEGDDMGRMGWREPTFEEQKKVRALTKVELPADEARHVVKIGVAERADDF